jgi:HD-GYP domain-containing protein (c-di-GMP phosphodiesterase class II)
MAGPEDDARLQELVRDVLTRFHLVLKIAKVYETGNRLVQEHIGPLYRALTLLLHAEGGAVLRVHHNALFFNRTRLRFDLSNQHVHKFIAGELTARGVAAIAFSEGISPDELSRFVGVLSGREAGQTIPFEVAVGRLREAKIVHVTVEASAADEGEAGPEARTAKAYFLGIGMLREIIERQKRKGGFSLALARRWMQAMIRHLGENESFCLGLVTQKNADGYHPNHGVNVAVLAAALGRRLNLPRKELAELGVSALLHDLGTLEVSPAILDKPAALTEDERTLLDKQALLGTQKLIPLQSGRPLPVKALEVALEHRLLMDQSNRQSGAVGRSIHLFSRIVRIADAYDALTTKRVYRPQSFTPEEALKLMDERSGQDFDPLLLKAFAAMMGPYPVGSLVALDDGEIGLVIETNPRRALAARPKIKLITDADGRKRNGPLVDLTEAGDGDKKYKRTIVLSLNADAYGVRPIDYFLASAR